MDVTLDSIVLKHYTDGMEMPKEYTDLEKYDMVSHAKTIMQLMVVLDDIGPIDIGDDRGFYDMGYRMRQVMMGEPVNLLTRKYGIRQQYLYLSSR